MASTGSSTPSLTPSRSPTPEPPVQPNHFYGNENPHLPLSPSSDGRTWLDPADDPFAQRGIPVFTPTMDEFSDFEGYMNKIECWGMRSGIVKVIPPKEWRDTLPALNPQLTDVKLKNPIEQQMMGRAGLFRQQNIEKRKIMSVREWADLCSREELRAPGVDDVGLHARATNGTAKTRPRRGRRKTRDPETAEPEMTPNVMVKEEDEDHVGVSIGPIAQDETSAKHAPSPPHSSAGTTPNPSHDTEQDEVHDEHLAGQSAASPAGSHHTTAPHSPAGDDDKEAARDEEEEVEEKPKARGRRNPQTKESREAAAAERAAKDEAFLENFDPHSDWLPPNTTSFDYTPEFCKELERRFWRNCGLGRPAWYGADMQGSLFTDETTAWNVAHLPSALSRLLPSSNKGLPGVNTPYLYFGMWRATFAWHVEDMDLFSINYIHFGAPKFWYAVPQARAAQLESSMKGYFPKDTSNCPQFLRHKSYLASPNILSKHSCRPNWLVQHAGEFVITYPRGYHAGFNLGFNCAESVNFALESWLDLGRNAKVCQCVDFSVRIDIDQLLQDREAERLQAQEVEEEEEEGEAPKAAKTKSPRKRKAEDASASAKAKRQRTHAVKEEASPPPPSPPLQTAAAKPIAQRVTLKLGPQPKEPDVFPCCLCVSPSRDGLLRVQDPPLGRKEGESGEASGAGGVWYAHEECANVVPETWVDEVDVGGSLPGGSGAKERVVLGVDGIVKDRWNLKCNACTRPRNKAHGAPIQCTKGKCPKAFHVSCARDGASQHIIYRVVQDIEKEVVLLDEHSAALAPPQVPGDMDVDQGGVLAPHILKLIRKVEVELLCPQHNPAVAEAKKAAKQDRIRNELILLPPGARIKLRVSAGVFEVTLCRVIEESSSVEVLWDRGLKREFKWGSVVFGNTEGVVGQKPSEAAPESEPMSAAPPPPTFQVASGSHLPVVGTPPSFALRPPVTTYTQAYGHAIPYGAPSPQHVQPYQAYQGSYFAPYTPATYRSTPSTSSQYSSWTNYQYNQSGHRFSVGSMYAQPTSYYPAPRSTSTPSQASSSAATPVPLDAASSASTPQPPSNAPQQVQSAGERPAYTTMTYQPYAGQKYYHPVQQSSTPVARSAASTPASATARPAQTSAPDHTIPSFAVSNYSRTSTPSIVHPAQSTPPTFHAPNPVAPTATSLRWQQPYTGPKTTSQPSHNSSATASPAPVLQLQPQTAPS
ncbi:JmjC and ePHD domain-containing protein [Phanerochaete sordida]|uniref:[histone H3]-trimethyl-L-lysine(9) demethylase n=1 Tax=Phanerochaete sordida TaxID=48140 RepID=A0A9P3GF53_9APHY|nr:JmjC and ePHD domain-containing protein [Phanerochaete sordida]